MGKTLRRIPKKRIGKIIGDSDPDYGSKIVKKRKTKNSSFRRNIQVKNARRIIQEVKAA